MSNHLLPGKANGRLLVDRFFYGEVRFARYEAGSDMYLKDANVDPQSVWQVKDGAIWCSGIPTGCLRMTREYSDYKLTREWCWLEQPSNSGVLRARPSRGRHIAVVGALSKLDQPPVGSADSAICLLRL